MQERERMTGAYFLRCGVSFRGQGNRLHLMSREPKCGWSDPQVRLSVFARCCTGHLSIVREDGPALISGDSLRPSVRYRVPAERFDLIDELAKRRDHRARGTLAQSSDEAYPTNPTLGTRFRPAKSFAASVDGVLLEARTPSATLGSCQEGLRRRVDWSGSLPLCQVGPDSTFFKASGLPTTKAPTRGLHRLRQR